MPNRVIKDSIKRSSEIDSLTWFQEVCFYRLMVTVDDNGCYHANPQILKSDLFPLKEDLTKKAVAEALDQLESVGLIERYEIGGKQFLHMVTWASHQRIRNKINHYPMPPRLAANCGDLRQIAANGCELLQAAADGGDSRPESNPIQSNQKEKENARTRATPAPLISDEEALRIQADLDEVLDALRDAGFPQNEKAFKRYTDLLHEHGKPKMLEAVEICVDHSVSKLDYLKAVLAGMGKDKKTGNTKLDDENAQWEAIVRTQQESTWGVQQ